MYSVQLRIPVTQYLPEDIRPLAGRAFVNVCAFSPERRRTGERVILSENCRDAEVIGCCPSSRRPSDYNFILGN